MRAHVVENGVVVNTIEVDALDVFDGLVDGSVGGIGWTYDGSTFTAPAPPEVDPVSAVPESISRAQGKAALVNAGYWAAVTAHVAAVEDETQRALAEIALNDTQEWRRDSAFLGTLAAALGLTDAQLDELFVAAAQITF